MTRLKDIPLLQANGKNLKAFADVVREALQTFRGYRGDLLDRALTLRDFVSGQAYEWIAGAGAVPPLPYVPDSLPPPTPTGLAVSAGISHIFIECGVPTYTQGHGHLRTVVYGAKWPDGDPEPVFADAVELMRFEGTFTAYASDPATTWCIWIKWESNDHVLSIDPAGGTNGAQTTTGQDVRTLLQSLTDAAYGGGLLPYQTIAFRCDSFLIVPPVDFVQETTPTAGAVGDTWLKESTGETKTWTGTVWGPLSTPLPFIVQTAETVINGVTIPAGVYMESAFIYDLTASIARLGTLWVDDAMVANLSVAKLVAGSLQVGSYIQSAVYTAGVAGWKWDAAGNGEANNMTLRGSIYAIGGKIGGADISTTYVQSSGYVANTSGWKLDNLAGKIYGHSAYLRNAAGDRVFDLDATSTNPVLKIGSVLEILASGAAKFAGTVEVGSSPAISGTTMTGTGVLLDAAGKLAAGNSSKNMVFDGSALYLNGAIVETDNVVDYAIQDFASATSSTPFTAGPLVWTTCLTCSAIDVGANGSVALVCMIDTLNGSTSGSESDVGAQAAPSYRLRRGSTVLYTWTPEVGTLPASRYLAGANIVDAPGAGSNSYTLQIYGNNSSGFDAVAYSRSLFATGYRK